MVATTDVRATDDGERRILLRVQRSEKKISRCSLVYGQIYRDISEVVKSCGPFTLVKSGQIHPPNNNSTTRLYEVEVAVHLDR